MDDSLLFALLLWLWSKGGGGSAPALPLPLPPSSPSSPAPAPAPAPAPSPVPPAGPSQIEPGWWWYWFPTEDTDAFTAFQLKETRRSARRKVRRRWEVRKTMGGSALGATVVVFYVFDPFKWELRGLPERAPRGQDTDFSDVAWAIPEPPSALRRMVEGLAQKAWEALREIHRNRTPPWPI